MTPHVPIPFLLVDAHNAWLEPIFIAYINDIDHWWELCFGVPYATSLWKVGYLTESNGAFKSEFYQAKFEFIH